MAIRPTSSRSRAYASLRRTRSSGITKFRLLDMIAPQAPSHKPAKQQQPDSFHPFAKLPTELRLKIWALSLPRPRLVSVQCGIDISAISKPSTHNASYTGCTSPTRIPVNLQVCAESRAEALKSYQPSLGFSRCDGQVFFNFDVDILYFGPREGFMAADSQFHTCMLLCEDRELARVRRMAVNDALFWTGDTYNSLMAASFVLEMLKQVAARMTGLEELILVPLEDEAVVDQAPVRERMTRQMQTAMQTVTQLNPSWQPPSWKIVPLNELPSATG
ncbi:hypothetical protein GGI35DRAFT_104125 [Trichoderma velutinum]